MGSLDVDVSGRLTCGELATGHCALCQLSVRPFIISVSLTTLSQA